MTTTIRMHALIKPGVEIEKGWTPTFRKLHTLLLNAKDLPEELTMMVTIENFCPTCEHKSQCPISGEHHFHELIEKMPPEIKTLGYLGFEMTLVQWSGEGRLTLPEMGEAITKICCPNCSQFKSNCPSRERFLSLYTN